MKTSITRKISKIFEYTSITKKTKKRILQDYFGYARTVETGILHDDQDNPIPWMTYPAIGYLKQIDFSDWSIFEYGCGSSTEFWSRRAKKVISVEHDEQWADKISNLALPNVELICATGNTYVEACQRGAPHDVIVVDGRWRFDCAMYCLRFLSPEGLVILDNSERYPMINQYFRKNGLIQIDMIGHGPINEYIWSTSIFLSRNIKLKPLRDIQPHYLDGMIDSIEINPAMGAVNAPGSF